MGWLRPYAAKAKVEHEFDTDHLNVFVTFRFAMDETVKPPDGLWLVEVDDVPKPVSASAWQDAWTLLLTVPEIAVNPDRVTHKNNGSRGDRSSVSSCRRFIQPERSRPGRPLKMMSMYRT
ncbi:hypothetical protein ES703_61564 [subsurface metagenome]